MTLVWEIIIQDRMLLAYDASKVPIENRFRASVNKLKANKKVPWKELNETSHKLWANYADRGNMA